MDNENINTDFNTDFHENLLLLRKTSFLSQDEVANRLGISRQTLSKWETGKSCPDVLHTKKLSEIYQVTLNELMGVDKNDDRRNTDGTENSNYRSAPQSRKWLKYLVCFLIVDFVVCVILLSTSRYMLFWIVYFNILFLIFVGAIRLFFYIRAIVNQHIKEV